MAEENVRVLRFVDLNNFRQLSPVVKNHLKRVCITLICALVAFAFGVYLDMLLNIGGFFASLGVIGSMSWLHYTHTNQRSTKKRLCVLFLSTLLKGASIGPMIKLAIDLDSSILSNAIVWTLVVFAYLSCVSMLVRRREYHHLGASFTIGLSFLISSQSAAFINKGYSSASLYQYEIWLGLMIFMGYTLMDTQEILEKANIGDMDYVEHSFTCFTNVVAVFVRILIILFMLNKSENKLEMINGKAFAARNVCEITKISIYHMLVARANEA